MRLDAIRDFINKRPILSVAVPGTLALITATYGIWFALSATALPGSRFGSYSSNISACRMALHPENIKRLAKVMNFPLLEKSFGSTLERSFHVLMSRRIEQVPPHLPGAPQDRRFVPQGDQRIIDYSINCMYPPFVVKDDAGQAVGDVVEPLPSFCYVPPDSIASAVKQDPCTTLQTKAVGEVPSAFSPLCLKNDLGPNTPNSANLLNSIGALKVVDNNYSSTDREFWASGYMIGTNLFATACHALFPLFNKGDDGYPSGSDGNYSIQDKIALYVDFSVGSKSTLPMEVSAKFERCAKTQGLDVALLTLTPSSAEKGKSVSIPVPAPIPILYEGNPSKIMKAKPMAFVAYGDLRHPIDEPTSEMYYTVSKSALKGAYQKFAMWDPVVGKSKCYGVDYLLDDASTTVGSSGGLVIDVFKNYDEEDPKLQVRKQPLAAGVHKCCAAYFDTEQGAYEDESCVWMHRTPFNQDISSTSILKEPGFCTYLRGNVDIRDNDDNSYTLVCNGSSPSTLTKN